MDISNLIHHLPQGNVQPSSKSYDFLHQFRARDWWKARHVDIPVFWLMSVGHFTSAPLHRLGFPSHLLTRGVTKCIWQVATIIWNPTSIHFIECSWCLSVLGSFDIYCCEQNHHLSCLPRLLSMLCLFQQFWPYFHIERNYRFCMTSLSFLLTFFLKFSSFLFEFVAKFC